MNVLIIGSGGREHAMVKALSHSFAVDQIYASPGRSSWQQDCICDSLDFNSIDSLKKYLSERRIGLVVVGPENPLAKGIADKLRSLNVAVFGPSKEAAQLEASKAYAKGFMNQANVPTANYFEVKSVADTLQCAEKFQPPYVLKADGLAAGKGVFICKNLDELKVSAQKLFEEKMFGAEGERALLEEFQSGWELSVFAITEGSKFEILPFTQDHKRLSEGDKGPNTGGMGVVGPITIEPELSDQIENLIVRPSIEGLKNQGLFYRGVLYIGIMVTKNGPRVIEYNVRFGDPEAQCLFPLLDGDWGEVFLQVAQGNITPLKWKPLFASCVVLAAEGYPDSPKKGVAIEGALSHSTPSSYFLHAGTHQDEKENGKVTVAGGRVLNAVGLGSSLQESIGNAYDQLEKVTWPGMQFRADIGEKVLK